MPFELDNTPSTFIRLINQILKPFTSQFVVVYFDDILVYNKDIDDHLSYLRSVLEVFRTSKLLPDLKKM